LTWDPSVTDFETLARLFFETHDPTQVNRQGPDVGTQYRSAIFYLDDHQKEVSERLISLLERQGLDVATEVTPAGPVYPAEEYHQDYYAKTGGSPYCHSYIKRFPDE
ncbi:MAG: peptide-methionine (S)-S-oxide reductase, partial [Rhodothermales bacterium]